MQVYIVFRLQKEFLQLERMHSGEECEIKLRNNK